MRLQACVPGEHCDQSAVHSTTANQLVQAHGALCQPHTCIYFYLILVLVFWTVLVVLWTTPRSELRNAS